MSDDDRILDVLELEAWIRRGDVVALAKMTAAKAQKVLARLVAEGVVERSLVIRPGQGIKPCSVYRLAKRKGQTVAA